MHLRKAGVHSILSCVLSLELSAKCGGKELYYVLMGERKKNQLYFAVLAVIKKKILPPPPT